MNKMDRFNKSTQHVSLALRFTIFVGTLLLIATITLVILSSKVVHADTPIYPHINVSDLNNSLTRTPAPRANPQRNFDAPWPTNTPYPAEQEDWVEPTRWPTNTPRPTNAPPQATNTPWPTNTPRPTNNNYSGNGTDWANNADNSEIEPTKEAEAKADDGIWPTVTPTPMPTATVVRSYAMAFWYIDHDATTTGGDVWRTEIVVRVPTSYRYEFEIDNLVRSERTNQNVEGDDIYTLYLSGMSCNEGIQDELEVYQEGLLMLVSNEFSGQDEPISLTYDCR